MSASTGTIQRQTAQGPILRAIAVGVATLAAGALAWGAVNLSASKGQAAPVAAPAQLDKGSRFDTERAAPQAAPVPDSPGGFGGPRLTSPTYPRLRAS